MLKVAIRPRAQLDLESIYLHIAVVRGMVDAADKVIDEIYHVIDLIAEYPDMGSEYTQASLEHTYRRILAGNYWVFYTHDSDGVMIWRVFHTRRDIDDFTLTA